MVTLADFTERQLLSDYKFLEEAARLHDVAQRSEAPRPARQLPLGLQNFVDEVSSDSFWGLLANYAGFIRTIAILVFVRMLQLIY